MIPASRTKESWFSVWAAAIAVNTMCIQYGFTGKADNLGKPFPGFFSTTTFFLRSVSTITIRVGFSCHETGTDGRF